VNVGTRGELDDDGRCLEASGAMIILDSVTESYNGSGEMKGE
jgi:hypothetical protein